MAQAPVYLKSTAMENCVASNVLHLSVNIGFGRAEDRLQYFAEEGILQERSRYMT